MDLRTVAVVAVLGLAAGWALGGRDSATTPAPAAPAARGARPLGVETPAVPAPSTRELRRKLERQAESPRPTRNPFVFATRPATNGRAAAGVLEPEPAAPEPRTEVVAVPAGPIFRLAGVASSGEGEALVRTALVSGGPSLLFLRKGDTLPDGWTVAEVQEAAVVLTDGSGGRRVLRLP